MPLTTTIAELDEGIDILDQSFEDVFRRYRPATRQAADRQRRCALIADITRPGEQSPGKSIVTWLTEWPAPVRSRNHGDRSDGFEDRFVGATGNVGREMLNVLDERGFPATRSSRSPRAAARAPKFPSAIAR